MPVHIRLCVLEEQCDHKVGYKLPDLIGYNDRVRRKESLTSRLC